MKRFIGFFALFSLFACLLLSGCGQVKVTADLSAYGDTPITIIGIKDEPFTITASELAQLPCVSQGVSGKTEKAGSMQAVGPTLETFLEQYGKKKSDFQRIRFTASDSYKKGFLTEELEKHTFILAVANGDQPLSEKEAPLRLVIPGGASDQWVRLVTQIEFVTQ